jgi:protein SCO1
MKRRASSVRTVLLACSAVAASALAGGAYGEISPQALAQVGVHARSGAQAPLDTRFIDQAGRPATLRTALGGRPAVLLFEDYRCNTLCGPALTLAAHALADSGLRPGRDVGLVAIGLNPRETPADARAIRDSRLADAPAVRKAGVFLTGGEPAIAQATQAMGFGYAYDPASGQYTHPVAAFVLTPDGRLSRVLSQINMTGPELRDAVDGAGRGGLGPVIDQLALICHGISVAAGRYNGAVALGLKLGALATLAAMAGGLALLFRRRAQA